MDMTPSENYLTFQGGLYENSGDTVPADHNTAGLAAAAAIQPLDTNGNPSASGKIVFVAVGRSTVVDEFAVFVNQAATNSGVNHATLSIVNGALTGAMPCVWSVTSGPPSCDPTLGNQYDRVRDVVLAPLGLTEKQVQAAWIEEYNGDPAADGFQSLCDPTVAGCSNNVSHTEALRYEQQLGSILRAAKTRWPNLRQVFHSSRIYGGYATTNHSSEPYPYEYGFFGEVVDPSADSPNSQRRNVYRSHCRRFELPSRRGFMDRVGPLYLGQRWHTAFRWLGLV